MKELRKSELYNYKDLENLKKETEIVIIKTRPTKKLISEILNRCKLKCICISKSLYKLANKKVWFVLKEMKIKIKLQNPKLGRKRKHSKQIIKKAKNIAIKVGIRAASRKFKIPKSTLFNWIKRKN